MKKILLFIIIFEILFMSILGREIDCFLLQKNNYPIFSIPLNMYKDGGTKVFYGITYKIIVLQSLSFDSKEQDGYRTGTILLNWFQKINLRKYLDDENLSKFVEKDKYECKKNGIFILISFLLYMQIFVFIIILIKNKRDTSLR